jgi:hypothetical protein
MSNITRYDAIYSLVGSPLSGLLDGTKMNYEGGQTPPTKAEIDAEVIRLQAEYDALAWKRSREDEYPSIAELTIALYDTDDKSAVEAKRAAVKAKYPKPS